MRKILTREDIEKKERRNKFLIGTILVVIMLISVAGYSFFSGERGENGKKAVYNGFEFRLNEAGFWQTEISNYGFMFQHLPNETEEINVSLTLSLNMNSYANKPLYFYSENPAATREIAQNLGNFVFRMQEACIDENCSGDLPIKNCSDNLIIIKEKEISGVLQEDNCVFILGNYSDLVKISDLFLYKLLGVK